MTRRSFHPKWAGPNTPFIKYFIPPGLNEERLYLSKRELKDLANELNQFIEYYNDDFSDERIDIEDEPYEPFESTKKDGSAKS